MKNVLSIDFDFFVREDPMWDWGHSENQAVFNEVAWSMRYQSLKLYEECNPARYADFKPDCLIGALRACGMTFSDKIKVGIADSHIHAYKFIKDEVGKCNVINFDAHHDMFDEGDELNCANWAAMLRGEGIMDRYFWVKPKHISGNDYHEHKVKKWKVTSDFYQNYRLRKGLELKIDAVFFCRSSVWVPPHLDEKFEEMIMLFEKFVSFNESNVKLYGKLPKREVITEAQAEEVYKTYQKIMQDLREKQTVMA